MNERILKILEEMDRYLDGGSMLAFIALNRKRIWFDVFFTKQQKEQDINVLELTIRSITAYTGLIYAPWEKFWNA